MSAIIPRVVAAAYAECANETFRQAARGLDSGGHVRADAPGGDVR
nr:hypothetical protein [Mycobacterium riyadhense]